MTALIPCSRQPLAASDYSFLDSSAGADRTILWVSLVVAVILHLVAGMISLPESDPPIVVQPVPVPPEIRILELQPPKEKPVVQDSLDKPIVRLMPVPSTTDIDLEPLREEIELFENTVVAETAPTRLDFHVEPVPPPGLVYEETKAGLILPQAQADRMQPIYPPIAIKARRGGVVHLSAIITDQGKVATIEVLRAPDPDLGFSEAAIEAVTHWVYEPGSYRGRPVSVRMTVIVEFLLN